MADLNFKDWKDSLRSFIEASANDIKWLQQLKVDKEQKIISENPELFEVTGGWTDEPTGDGNYRIKVGTGLQGVISDSHKRVTVRDGDELSTAGVTTTEANGLILRGSEQEIGIRTATRNNFGVVKLSSDLDVDQDGKLIITKDDFELNPATETDLGGVIVPLTSKIDVDALGKIDVGSDVATGVKFNSSTKILTLINKDENGVTSGYSEVDLSGIAEMGTHFWYNPDSGDGYGYLEIYEDEEWDAVNNRPKPGATPTTSIPILDMLEGIGTELKFGDGSAEKEKYKLFLTDDSKTEYLSDGVSINIENVKELETELGKKAPKTSLVKTKEGIEVRRTRSPEGAWGSQTQLGDTPEFRLDKDFEDFNKYRTKLLQDTMHWRLKVGTSEIDIKSDGGDGNTSPDTIEFQGAGGVTVSKTSDSSKDVIEIKGTTYSEISEAEVVNKTSSATRLISGRRFWKGFSTHIAEWWSGVNIAISKVTGLQTALNNKEDSFTKNTAFNKDFGTGSDNVARGNHTHIISDVDGLQGALDSKLDSETTYTASKGVQKIGNDFQANYDDETLKLIGVTDTLEVVDSPKLGGLPASDYLKSTDQTVRVGSTSIKLVGNEWQREAFTTGDVTAPINSNKLTIVANAVDSGKIKNDAVITDKIKDLSVTTDKIAGSAVTFAKMQNIPTKTLIGRYMAGDGKPQSITLGGNLTLSATGVLDSANDNNTYTASKGVKKVTDDFQADIDGTTIGLDGNTMQVLDSPSLGGIEADKYATEQYVDDIEIGGRNYLPNSDFSIGGVYGFLEIVNNSPTSNFDLVDGNLKMTFVEGQRTDLGKSNFLSEYLNNDDAIVSIWVKGDGALKVRYGQSQNTVKIVASLNTWQKLVWELPGEGNGNLIIELSRGEVNIDKIKIEKGNKATDWTPAPEDQVTDWAEDNADAFSYLKNVPSKLKSATDDDVDNWNASLHEVDSKATKIEAEAGTNNTKYMTPLRTVEAMKGHEWIDYDPFEVYDTIVNGTTP